MSIIMKKQLIAIFIIALCLLTTGCTENGISLYSDYIVKLPDISVSEKEGLGFTCTGLAYDSKENVFWAGHVGKMHESDTHYFPVIIKLSKDFKTVLDEIHLYKIFPEMNQEKQSGLQGVCYDEDTDTLWISSPHENLIRNIDKQGKLINSIDCERVNSVAVDNRKAGMLYVLTPTKIIHMKKSGEIISSSNIKIKGADQLYLDEENNKLLISADNDYQKENYIYSYCINTKKTIKKYTLKDSFAIEGIYYDGEFLFVLNDGYYHNAKVKENQVNAYKITLN